MGEAKFTPGPWVWDQQYKGHGRLAQDHTDDPEHPFGDWVLWSAHDSEDQHCRCLLTCMASEADADLIAAAPELYEALWNLAEVTAVTNRDMEAVGDARLAAYQVLAKAQGKTLAQVRGELGPFPVTTP